MTKQKNNKKRSSALKRITKGVFIITILLLLLVVFAPTILNQGPGARIFAGVINDRIIGLAEIKSVELSWFGEQAITELHVKDRSGHEAANVDIHLNVGLFELITGGANDIEASVTGTFDVHIREDGVTSIEGLIKENTQQVSTQKHAEPIHLASLPNVVLKMDRMTARLVDEKNQRTIQLDDLNGVFTYSNIGVIHGQFNAQTTVDDLNGAIRFEARLENLINSTGELKVDRATMHSEFHVESVPVPLQQGSATVRTFEMTINSDDLTDVIDATISLDAEIDGRSSELTGELSLRELFDDSGAISFSPQKLTGELHGHDVPTSLLQSILKDSPIIVERDLGPTLDIDATISDSAQREITVVINTPRLSLELAGTVNNNDGTINGDRLHLVGSLHSELIEELTHYENDGVEQFDLTLSSFILPWPDDQNTWPINQIGVTGELLVASSVVIRLNDDEDAMQSLVISDARLNIDAETLATGIYAQGEMIVDGGQVTFDQTIKELFDDKGVVAKDQARLIGTVEIVDLPIAFASQFAPQQSELLEEVLGQHMNGQLTLSPDQSGQGINLHLEGRNLEINLSAVRETDALRIIRLNGRAEMTPHLARMLIAEEESDDEQPPPSINAIAAFEVEPFVIPTALIDGFDLQGIEPTVVVTISHGRIEHLGPFQKPVELRDARFVVQGDLSDVFPLKLTGGMTIANAGNNKATATVSYDLNIARIDEEMIPAGTMTLREISISQLETMLGRDPGSIAEWTGEQGEITLRIDQVENQQRVEVDTRMERMSGLMTAMLDEKTLSIEADSLSVVLAAETLNGLTESETEIETPQPRSRITNDVPVNVSIQQILLPREFLYNEEFDPALVHAEVTISGGPVSFQLPDQTETMLEELQASIQIDDLNQGISFTVKSKTNASGETDDVLKTGEIDIKGTLTHVIGSDGVFEFDDAILALEGQVLDAPTAVIDSLLRFDGLLEDSIGAQLTATLTADEFTRSTGRLDARMDTTNGWLEGTVVGRDEFLHTIEDESIRAELEITPPMRDRLLKGIHPVLADIRWTEHPLKITVTHLTLPADNDLRKLNADVLIEIGRVEYDAGSSLLAPLGFVQDILNQVIPNEKLNPTQRIQTVPGYVDPIKAKIRNGIVTYDEFSINVDKVSLVYTGSIDLPQQTLDIYTEIPGSALAKIFKEVREISNFISVPFHIHGPIDDPKVEPDFGRAIMNNITNIGNILDIFGVKKPEGEENNEKKSDPLGDLLGDLLGGKRKKKEESPR